MLKLFSKVFENKRKLRSKMDELMSNNPGSSESNLWNSRFHEFFAEMDKSFVEFVGMRDDDNEEADHYEDVGNNNVNVGNNDQNVETNDQENVQKNEQHHERV